MHFYRLKNNHTTICRSCRYLNPRPQSIIFKAVCVLTITLQFHHTISDSVMINAKDSCLESTDDYLSYRAYPHCYTQSKHFNNRNNLS